MGKITGFLEIKRELPKRRPVAERIHDWQEVYLPFEAEKLQKQGARCMDCGIPFCHQGCPLGNLIPDWNDLVYRDRWREAIDRLHATNNFPEFTGRLCPAPCEGSCVLGINDDPVTIKQVEVGIIEHAFDEGWVAADAPGVRTGKKVAVVGSGPAGLAAAEQLNRAGHAVTVFEKSDRVGGLLRYGIPEFKMEKRVLERRLRLMEASGVGFRTGVNVGVSLPVATLRRDFDAIVLAGGAEWPRDLPIPGRDLDGIHFAMDYLTLQNHRSEGDAVAEGDFISARGKNVVIIGGGDTGADCLGTAHRQARAPSPSSRSCPGRPKSGIPGAIRGRSGRISSASPRPTRKGRARVLGEHYPLLGADGRVSTLHAVRVEMVTEAGRASFRPIPGTEYELRGRAWCSSPWAFSGRGGKGCSRISA